MEREIELRLIGLFTGSSGDDETDIFALLIPNSGEPTPIAIFIGAKEANAILVAIEMTMTSRPLTIDLLDSAITKLGGEVRKVTITELKNDTFYSIIFLTSSGGSSDSLPLNIDARPSDAIALALRAGCSIYAREDVLKKAWNSYPEELKKILMGLCKKEKETTSH